MNSALNGSSENWRAIPGYEGMYEVSDHGRVRSLDRVTQASNRLLHRKGKIIKTNPDTHGYLQFRLWKDGQKKNAWVHQVVLEAFDRMGSPGEEGCHNNGDKSDNTPGNLRWDTKLGNMLDRKLHGTQIRGEQVKTARLTAAQVLEIRALYGSASNAKIAAKFGISRGYVAKIQNGKKWAHLL
jgi:hypothetical protein